MSKLIYAAAVLAALSVPALADTNAQMLRQMPADTLTVTDWYKHDVYDPSNNKIGEIMDVLLDKSGKVTSLIIGVGGFLGAGKKTSQFLLKPSGSRPRTTRNSPWS
jgi:sporulation protein YlmC with PRC-barrel domain